MTNQDQSSPFPPFNPDQKAEQAQNQSEQPTPGRRGRKPKTEGAEPRQKRRKGNGDSTSAPKFELQTILAAANELKEEDLLLFEKLVGMLHEAGATSRERLMKVLDKVFG